MVSSSLQHRGFSSHRGLSLAEVVIGSTLLFLIAGIGLKALHLASSYQKRIEAQQFLTEKTFEVVSRMESELEESSIDLFLLDTPHQALTCLLPRDQDGQLTTIPESGELIWSLAVSYSLEDGQIVRRQSLVPDPSTQHSNPLELNFDTNFFSTLPVNRVLAKECTLFEFEYVDRLGYVGTTPDGTAAQYEPPPTTIGEPVPLEEPSVVNLRLKLRERGDRTYGVTIRSTIYPKN